MSLTNRQLEILTLKAEGKTNLKISGILHISTSIVETELTKICEHFRVSSPPAAISAAQKNGTLPAPEMNTEVEITPAELQVGKLVAAGKSNKEISGLLRIGERAVAKRISSMLRKLGCSNRAQLAAALTARGVM